MTITNKLIKLKRSILVGVPKFIPANTNHLYKPDNHRPSLASKSILVIVGNDESSSRLALI